MPHAPLGRTAERHLGSRLDEQLALLRIVGDVLTDIGEWPVYQYVEARMDELGLEADAVLRSMPYISNGQLSYSLVRRDHSTAPDARVKLTIAGFAHLPAHAGVVGMFLAVLNELSDRRAKAEYERTTPVGSTHRRRACTQ